jgi:hypothetical protein
MLGQMELQILIWVVVGAGITAGVFLLARAVVEVGAVAYAAIERNITRRQATERSAALLGGAVVALVATAIIAAIAVLTLFAGLLQNGF